MSVTWGQVADGVGKEGKNTHAEISSRVRCCCSVIFVTAPNSIYFHAVKLLSRMSTSFSNPQASPVSRYDKR
jgi:hypothetical protein